MFWSSSQRSMNRLASILYPSMPSLRAVGRSSCTDHLYPWFSGHPFILLSRGAIYAMCTGHTRAHMHTHTHTHTHTQTRTHAHTHTHILHRPHRQHTQKYISTHCPHMHTHTYMHNFVCMPIAITARCLLCVCMCFSVLLVCFASGMMHKQTTLFTVNEARFPFTNSPYLFEGLIWKYERLSSVVCLPWAFFCCVYLCFASCVYVVHYLVCYTVCNLMCLMIVSIGAFHY